MRAVFASEMLAEPRHLHWVLSVSSAIVLILLLTAIYVAARTLSTKAERMSSAPLHIQRSTAILKWIAAVAPLLMLLGTFVDDFYWILETGNRGPVDFVFLLVVLAGSMVPLSMGIIVSLVAATGIGLIFVQSLWRARGKG